MCIRKRIIGILLIFALFISSITLFDVKHVSAESIENATPYMIGTSYSGMLTENGDDRYYYRFTLPESGSIKITGSAYVRWVYLRIYDENANELWEDRPGWNSTSEVISMDYTVYLTSGNYYFCVERYYDYYGKYDFNIDFTSIGESFNEVTGGSNNTLATANTVEVNGTSYNAQIAQNDDKDFFKFVLSESGRVNFDSTFYNMKWVDWKLYDETGVELISERPMWNDTTENIVLNEELYLTSGIYYIAVSRYDYICGKYIFSLSFMSSNEDYKEINGGSNNSISSASSLTLGDNYKGEIAINDEKDFYNFALSSSQSINISLEAGIKRVYVKLYDSKGDELWSEPVWCNDVTGVISFNKTAILEKGKYYIAVVKDDENCGNYTLNISTLTQGNCPHEECDSQRHDATYFSKGYTLYICKLCGYSYKGDYVSKKILSQGYVSSYSRGGSKSLELSWSSISGASGYQIRYYINKSSKKTVKVSGTSCTIRGLKKNKTYKVQVRAYVKEGSKTAYGKWSDVKKIRTL